MYVNKFNLYLIRHGQSVVNARSDEMGQLHDTPLSLEGQKQVILLHDRFKKEELVFNKIYSSDYKRAIDTAKGINQSYPMLTSALREYSAGDWTGLKRSEILTAEVLMEMNIHNNQFLPPNGESLSQVERRASKWLEEEILYNKDMFDNNIAVFSHGLTIKCLLHYILCFDKSFTWKISIDNTSITHLSFGDKGWKLHSVNDTAHLK